MKTAREMEDELQALIDSAVKDNQSAQDQLRELGRKGQARRDGGELDGELNENNIARNKKMREDEENRLLAAKNINATVTEAVQMVQGGLKLLEQTFEVNSENTKALGRVLQAIDSGTLTVNGQAPDKDYAIGEYLIHGGRVKFDVSQLDATQQKQFFQFITNKQAENRPFATHRAGGVDASGHSAEIKSGLWGAVVDLGLILINKSNHYGINLAVGGRQPSKQGPGKNQIPDESGQWGHMYLHKDKNIVLVGIEASAPNKHNLRTGEAHSKTGGAGEYSAFLEYKINSTALQDDQKKDNKCPLSTKEKNNWANISISPEQFKKLKIQVSSIESTNSQDGYSKLVNKTPSNATEAASDRFEQMSNWASATKKGNKTSFLAKALGVLMIVAGIVLAAVPIPIVTQALGGGLIAMGIGIATAAIGVGVTWKGSQIDPKKAQKIYSQSELPSKDNPVSDDNVEELSSSTTKMFEIMEPGTEQNTSPAATPKNDHSVKMLIEPDIELDPEDDYDTSSQLLLK